MLEYLGYYIPGSLWKPYLGTKPCVSWEELDSLYGKQGPLQISSPIPSHAPRCHSSSPEEALIKSSTARYVEQEWEGMMFGELCKGDFDAAFFLGPNTAIICVRRKDPGIFIDDHATWDDHMNIFSTFEAAIEDLWHDSDFSDEGGKTVFLNGHVMSNQTCEIVVLPERIPAELYKLAKPLKEAPAFTDLSKVYIEVNDKSAKDQVESLNTLVIVAANCRVGGACYKQ